MPFIQARLSLKLEDAQKDDLQKKLTEIVGAGFSKPKTYIMAEVVDNCSLYMAENKLEKCAYISVKLLGSASKSACNSITQQICAVLDQDYGIDGTSVYVTYHPVDLWGWNGMMF